MKQAILALIILCLLVSSGWANCPTIVYDYDSGQYLHNTDAQSRCQKAVKKAVGKACDEAYRICRLDCGTDNKCEQACRKGRTYCESSYSRPE